MSNSAAGIAHEINNTLAFVVNNLFIVENGLDGLGREMEHHLPEPSRSKLRKALLPSRRVRVPVWGLAISHGIVEDHGGSIEVQSEEGVGAEFIVRIPLELELQARK